MRQKSLAVILMALISSSAYSAQNKPADSNIDKTGKSPAAHTTAYFIDPTLLNLALIVPPPPAQNSETTKSELVDLHQIESLRTSPQIHAAQTDDKEQDIFIFKDVLGENFTADHFPQIAALSAHIHSDEGLASKTLKTSFARPRPFQYDATLHPVCTITKEPNSYPSGHTLSGYLLAFTLIQIVPEKQQEIMQRADNYAHNRMVCGVHYQSDIEAGRRIAYVMFGYMLASPRFQAELTAAREETRSHLGLPPSSAHS